MSRRAIPKPATDVAIFEGGKHSTTKIRADKLSLSAEFQRLLKPGFIDRLIKDFNLDAIGVITVSRRADGKLIVVDGQHRISALLKLELGEWEVDCNVYEQLTLEKEAALYRLLKLQRILSSWDDFKAGYWAQDPTVLDIMKIASSHGLKVDGNSRDGIVACVATLTKIYRRKGGAATLDAALGNCVAAWGHTAAAVEKDVLGGMAIVVESYNGAIDSAVLVKKLSKVSGGPSALIGKARGLRDIRKAPLSRLIASLMVGVYNKGKHGKQVADL